MKIGVVVPGGAHPGGRERVFPWLLALLRRLTAVHDVRVFSTGDVPGRDGPYRLEGARVYGYATRPTGNGAVPFGGGRGARPRLLRGMLGEHRRERLDLIHVFFGTGTGPVARLAGAVLGVPVLLHLAGGETVALPGIGYGAARTLRGRLQLRLAAGADRVTTASRPMVELAAARDITAERLPLGVDLSVWPPAEPRPREADRPARLLHVGSLNPVKDQATLLRAARRLADDDVAYHLDIVGVDTLDGELHRLAGELGLGGRVAFHGFLHRDRLRPLFDRADLLVISSRHEAGPMVALEAAVAGVPVVGTAVGHLAEWADHDPPGAATVRPGDAPGLADAIAAVLDDDTRRLALARTAQRRAVEEDADATARRVLDIYEALAGSPGAPLHTTSTA